MSATTLNFSPKGLYIGGAGQESAGGETFETINPSTGEKLGTVPMAGEAGSVAEPYPSVSAKTSLASLWASTPVGMPQ